MWNWCPLKWAWKSRGTHPKMLPVDPWSITTLPMGSHWKILNTSRWMRRHNPSSLRMWVSDILVLFPLRTNCTSILSSILRMTTCETKCGRFPWFFGNGKQRSWVGCFPILCLSSSIPRSLSKLMSETIFSFWICFGKTCWSFFYRNLTTGQLCSLILRSHV